ncbi:hypothetical protein V1502_11030 [Bacillus sp. SCS-153A]|uniref:hypothetical protein n=1 Tax=Rossellomorea sedimentorum TaxID=3115294 RepID=UPI0039066A86
MFSFLNREKLIKDDLKGIAKLMYEDVSSDAWDQEYLTKRNLDFSIESVRLIDRYVKRLLDVEYDTDLLDQYYDHFIMRLGAYIGEVIRRELNEDFYWYESHSVHKFSPDLDKADDGMGTVLYSRKRNELISPLNAVSQFLKGNPSYTSLLSYTEKTVNHFQGHHGK